MQNYKIKIRNACLNDSQSIFDWRNDEQSRRMFFNTDAPSYEEHNKWLTDSLLNPNQELYLGEMGDKRIGVCRFDIDSSTSKAEVSINMNPEMRGKNLGKQFLSSAIDEYLTTRDCELTATIKKKNNASRKIFEFVGFEHVREDDQVIYLQKPIEQVAFKKVQESDADVLIELLQKRVFSISHQALPSTSEHKKFVRSSPYRYWGLVLQSGYPVGTFYLQNDNSIGLNLSEPHKRLVHKIISYIHKNFKPETEVKSKIPPYFYVNISFSNEALREVMMELGYLPIQTSFKVS